MQSRKYLLAALLLHAAATLPAQRSATLLVDANRPGNTVSPTLHGVFFEEISHGGEGGLYAEMIQNRGFEEANIPPGMTLKDGFITPPRTPHFSIPNNGISDWKMEWPITSDYPAWSSFKTGTAAIRIARTDIHPLNNATPHSLQRDITADKDNSAGLINEGYWGMNIIAGDKYNLKFYLRSNARGSAGHYTGAITATLQGQNGNTLATYTFQPSVKNGDWQAYSATLTATTSDPKAKFMLTFDRPGRLWLDFVSLFPQKTFRGRPNGLRQDLAQYIADLKPAFVRWPGGCFVEGICIQSAPDWKNTIGPVESRIPTYSPWGYWATNGFGYHEYLQYCEDIGAAALYVFNAGVSCDFRSGTFVSDDSLQPYIHSALDAIEYAIGPITSPWGKVRAAAGHPMPFPLKYVEIGNEQVGPRYAKRYNIFYDAIKSKYPQITTLASMGIGDVNEYTLKGMKKVDYADEHAYKAAGWAMTHFDHFDKYQRGAWDLYVGEYATNGGVAAGNMEASLSDAIYIMGMEKNGDLVKMSSYAPLLVNTNDVDWPVNLINFDASASFARISYYAIQMMNENRADRNLATELTVTPPAEKKPAFSGGIGLATWDTKTAYKDIEVIENGQTVYKSDFTRTPRDWNLLRGQWDLQDSALIQSGEGAQRFAMLKDRRFTGSYTLKMKAKKIGGYNAFIIPFAVKDENTFYRAHIGAWVNKVSVFEKVTNGFDVGNISSTTPLADTIVTNRWYDITLEVGIDTVKCYLNGKLLMSYTEPNKLFAIAGRKNDNGDLIIKLVNGYADPMPLTLDLRGISISAGGVAAPATTDSIAGELITLSAPQLSDENSYEHPLQYTPVHTTFPPADIHTPITLQPYSINIIRLHANSMPAKK